MYLLIDVGGTNTRVAVSSDNRIDNSEVFDTPKSFEEGVKKISEVSERLLMNEETEGVIIGAPGPISLDKKQLLNAPNLKDWIAKPLADELQQHFKCEVCLFNDADLVGLGEAHFGAGEGFGIVAYLTVSTGVGGTRVVDGKLDRYVFGFEPGHQIIDMEHSFEDMAGGVSLFNKYGIRPEEINNTSVWSAQAKIIAVGVHNTIVMWSPDVVVLGGSQMKKAPIDLIRSEVGRLMKIFPEIPEIKLRELGDEGGLWGGLAAAKQEFT